MRVPRLHPWPTDAREAIALQGRLRDRLVLRGGARRWRRVAGADVSHDRGGDRLFAAVVVVELPDLEVVEVATAVAPVRFPYVPGLLSFRETPPVLEAFRRIRTRPEAVICDAHGLSHPRRFGLACHLGLWLDIPTVGCAKTRLVGEESETGPGRGDHAPLHLDGHRVGATVRTRVGVKPVYVSPGHRIGLSAAIRLVLLCGGGFRLPEPTRQAHLQCNRLRREEDAGRTAGRGDGRGDGQGPSRSSKKARSRAR